MHPGLVSRRERAGRRPDGEAVRQGEARPQWQRAWRHLDFVVLLDNLEFNAVPQPAENLRRRLHVDIQY